MSQYDKDRVYEVYARIAGWYDRARSKDLMEKAYLELVASRLPPGGGVLDLGCGSGEPIARYFIEKGCKVTGIDAAEPMIALCRQRFPQAEWIVGDMRTLALGRQFDAILAWDSFFHLPHDDQRRMFEVFERHAREGCTLLFTSGPKHGEAVGEMNGHAVYHASLDEAEYRALLERHGFTVLLHRVEDPDCGGHTVWVGRRG